ncbi:hypothetical protein AYO44_12325 [Planctomycetaceae bacterium SCGC AG-212-F19]|nr:hypothetical protein AYO44_12325 [Planctomycetaceae bacterium SCGC AG-212-F19]
MAKTGPAKYSAAPSLQGYIYQCRYALLLMLRRIRLAPTAKVAVEKFDDVSFEKGGAPKDLVQTKYHGTPGNLSDGSEDWWKTLRIWSEGVRDRHFLLPGVTFSLITTQTAPAGSAAEALRAVKARDPIKAEALLLAAANGTNQKLQDAFNVFKKLSKTKRGQMLAEVYVFDAACSVGDLDKHLLEELRLTAPRGQESPFLEQVEGWWYRRLIRHLETAGQPAISGGEVQEEIERVRDGYSTDNLPIERPLPDPPQPPDPANDPRAFVQCLRKLGLTDHRLRQSILDFYRATVHRDRWVTDTLLNFEEIEDYDDRLLGEWDRLCDSLMSEFSKPGADRAELGRKLFYRLDEDAARHSVFFIRPRCTEPAIGRGSLHKLADTGKLGWHPDDVSARRTAKGGVP